MSRERVAGAEADAGAEDARGSTDGRRAEPHAPPPLPLLDDGERKLAKALLFESREELTRADAKASLLLATLGIGLSAILAATLAGDWTPFSLKEPYQAMWWIGSAWAGISFFCLCAAVYPKVKHKSTSGGITYFGDVAALKTEKELRVALRRSETDPHARTITQLHVISRLAGKKYAFIRAGLLTLGLAIAFTLAAVLAAHFG
jgi:hypothetical protein